MYLTLYALYKHNKRDKSGSCVLPKPNAGEDMPPRLVIVYILSRTMIYGSIHRSLQVQVLLRTTCRTVLRLGRKIFNVMWPIYYTNIIWFDPLRVEVFFPRDSRSMAYYCFKFLIALYINVTCSHAHFA